MRVLHTGLCLAGLLIVIVASPAGEKKSDIDLLQGVWECKNWVINGKMIPKEAQERQKLTVTFKGNALTFEFSAGNQGREFTYILDPSKKPKTIDMTAVNGPDKEKTAFAIYSLEGDMLKICMPVNSTNNERPMELDSTPGSNAMLIVLKRLKK